MPGPTIDSMTPFTDASQPSYERPAKVTKSDSVDFPRRPRALQVGTAGSANLVYDDGTAAAFPLVAGPNPVGNIKRINTGGDADNIWLLF